MPDVRRVLVVDDEESMLLLLGRTLEAIPAIEVTLADGCESALRLIAEHAYDLILLDLLMPGIGGIAVLSRIRESSLNQETPVVVVSVMADEATKTVCKSMGASDYVVKPIERSAVLRVVQARLGLDQG